MPATIVKGNVLTYPGYIVHQCNCVTSRPMGLSEQIFKKFPDANIYRDGTPREPGEIVVRGKIIAFLAQNTPGKPKPFETAMRRESWFRACLEKLKTFLKENEITDVAFPYGIGCGLAGGNWTTYMQMIEEFAKDFNVVIYRLV